MIQQWKTVAEFECDEQQKYIVFRFLKYYSTGMLVATFISILLSVFEIYTVQRLVTGAKMADIFLNNPDIEYVKKYTTPQCWPNLQLNNHDIAMMIRNITEGVEGFQAFEAQDPNYRHDFNFLYDQIEYGNTHEVMNSVAFLWRDFRSGYLFSPKEVSTYYCLLVIRSLVSLLTIVLIYYLYQYYAHLIKLYMMKNLLPEGSKLLNIPLFRNFLFYATVYSLHSPPIFHKTIFNHLLYPYQLVTFIRLLTVLKYLREHHPMRYNRMTEILCTLSSTRLDTHFLIKSPFLRTPLKAITTCYTGIVLIATFCVFSIEKWGVKSTCPSLSDTWWLVMVTTTNLGFGDILAGNTLSRLIITTVSILGIVMMALLVNYVSEIMVIPPDEKRIMGFYEKHRMYQLRRVAAANLIKASFRRYRSKCKVQDLFTERMTLTEGSKFEDAEGQKKRVSKEVKKSLKLFEGNLNKALYQSKIFEIDYQHQFRHWLKIKSQTQAIHNTLEKGFAVDDTAILSFYKILIILNRVSIHSKKNFASSLQHISPENLTT